MSRTILIVEDDIDIHNLEKTLLEENGYNTLSAFSGTEALLLLEHKEFDLVLLDIMLPGMFGDEVIKKLKQETEIPVIAVTSKDDKESKISMFNNGVDDYITKPFDVDEFLLRITAVLRRYKISESPINNTNILKYKDINLNCDTYEVKVSDKEVSLTKIEFKILRLLMSKPKNVFTKNNIYSDIWNDNFIGEDNSVNVHISNIRNKLSKINKDEKYIQTVWGIGFKME
ncbi:response regulator transcription factor [Clostridium thermobutyricum]|uniref:response regulator transcription factor n=1 Tax=Clostridium thermobutyricum TaxID=29372 RepID=UPI0018AB6B8E|nr:response regulator transcription factor [Clostridium thermobutyricum]